MDERGKFITIEGIEGVGKSTVLHFLQHQLQAKKIKFTLTREPGGTAIAEDIRSVLLANHQERMSADTELLLMFAGRAQNISEVIRPALSRGEWVLSDRFTDASYAYQGGGRGIASERIDVLASWVQQELRPDLTLLLDAPVEVGLKRMASRGAKDRIEKEGVEFFDRVRAAYLQRAKHCQERFVIIDASHSPEKVCQDVWQAVEKVIS